MAAKYHFNVVIVGDYRVGKTTLLTKCINKKSLIGIVPFERHAVNRGDRTVILHIHDTYGVERFKRSAISPAFYREADGVLLCFDIMQKESFINLTKWLVDVKDCLQEDIPILVVGIDRIKLPRPLHFREFAHTDQGAISQTEIDCFCKDHKLQYIKVDLNNKEQIDDVFDSIADLMMDYRRQRNLEVLNVVRLVKDKLIYRACYC